MNSKHYLNFQIGTCSHKGCVNMVNKTCWLDGLEFKKYAQHAEHLHTPKLCIARRQVDLYKTEGLLYND